MECDESCLSRIDPLCIHHIDRMNLLLRTAKIEYEETCGHASLQIILKVILAWDTDTSNEFTAQQFVELLDAGLIGALGAVIESSIDSVDFSQVDSGLDMSEWDPMERTYQWAQECLLQTAYNLRDPNESELWDKDSSMHLDRKKYMTRLQEIVPVYVRSLKRRTLLFKKEATYLRPNRSLAMNLLGSMAFPTSFNPDAPNIISKELVSSLINVSSRIWVTVEGSPIGGLTSPFGRLAGHCLSVLITAFKTLPRPKKGRQYSENDLRMLTGISVDQFCSLHLQTAHSPTANVAIRLVSLAVFATLGTNLGYKDVLFKCLKSRRVLTPTVKWAQEAVQVFEGQPVPRPEHVITHATSCWHSLFNQSMDTGDISGLAPIVAQAVEDGIIESLCEWSLREDLTVETVNSSANITVLLGRFIQRGTPLAGAYTAKIAQAAQRVQGHRRAQKIPRDAWSKAHNTVMNQVLPRFCTHCGEEEGKEGQALQKCARCNIAMYCSKPCQRQDWARHKPACKLT